MARIGINAVTGTNVFVVIKVIETANLERTVIGTITSTDTAIIGHRIDTLFGVDSSSDWTNLLAWSSFTVHTGHRFLNDVGVRLIALEVAIKTQPVHFATIHDLFATYDGNIVLTLAGNNTCTTANALAKINRHSPLGNGDPLFLVFGLQLRERLNPRRTFFTYMWNVRPLRLGEFRKSLVKLCCTFTHQSETSYFCLIATTLINRPMVLCGCQHIVGVSRTPLDTVGDHHAFATTNR